MEISAYGDQVKINAVGEITVNNYAPNLTTITPQQLAAAQTILEIDQAKYFAFYIDDVDNAQVKPKLMGEAMRKAAYALGDTADQLIAGFHSDAGVTVTSTAMLATGANALTPLSEAAKALDEANVPAQGRWAAIPPWYHQLLIRAGILETDGSIDANAMFTNGFLGRAFGFELYMSNNLSTSASASPSGIYALAGTNRAMSFAEQIVKMEAYRPENAFSDAVKGLHVYGAKTIDPNALVRLNIEATSTS